jgi:methyl-accepting chemotaxis protein
VKRFADISLPFKLLIAGIVFFLAFSAALFSLYAYAQKQASISAYVEKARAVCLTAESAFQEMEEKWQQGLFTVKQMRLYEASGEQEKLLSAIPVISASRVVTRNAKQGEYFLRLPTFGPRNPVNQPDYGIDYVVEGPALKKIKAASLKEYFVMDEQANAIRYFRPVRVTKTCLVCHGDPKHSRRLWRRNDGKDLTGGAMENWKVGEIHGAFEVIQSLAPADKQLRTDLLQAGLFVLIALVITISLFFLIARSIVKPINEGVAFAENLAEGDLSQTLDMKRGDEVGSLAVSMNQLVENLGDMFNDMAGGIDKLFASSNGLSSISQQMSTNTEQSLIKSNDVAASAELMSANMNEVATAVQEISTKVELLASATESMTGTINDIAQNSKQSLLITEKAFNQVQNTSETVDELGKAVIEIGEVIQNIDEISEKTDLLALNASIEVARAGESGEGFGGVTREIEQLARQTTDAALRIRQVIQLIQDATADTIGEIEQLSSIMGHARQIGSTIDGAVEKQLDSTREISSKASQASSSVQVVSKNVAQNSNAVNGVANDILQLDQFSVELSDNIAHVQTSAEDLENIAGQLKGLIKKFKFQK